MKDIIPELKSKFEAVLNKNILDASASITLTYDAAIKSMQAAYELGKADEWISVSEKLKPDDNQWVTCADLIRGEYDILLPSYSYSKDFDTYTGYGEAYPDERVTHWKPLPNPPQK